MSGPASPAMLFGAAVQPNWATSPFWSSWTVGREEATNTTGGSGGASSSVAVSGTGGSAPCSSYPPLSNVCTGSHQAVIGPSNSDCPMFALSCATAGVSVSAGKISTPARIRFTKRIQVPPQGSKLRAALKDALSGQLRAARHSRRTRPVRSTNSHMSSARLRRCINSGVEQLDPRVNVAQSERRLRRFGVGDLLLAHAHQQRPRAVVDDVGVDHAFADILQRGNLVHHVEEHFLDRGAQAAGARLALLRLLGGGLQRVIGEDQFHIVQGEELLVLLDDRVPRFGQNSDQVGPRQRVE